MRQDNNSISIFDKTNNNNYHTISSEDQSVETVPYILDKLYFFILKLSWSVENIMSSLSYLTWKFVRDVLFLLPLNRLYWELNQFANSKPKQNCNISFCKGAVYLFLPLYVSKYRISLHYIMFWWILKYSKN